MHPHINFECFNYEKIGQLREVWLREHEPHWTSNYVGHPFHTVDIDHLNNDDIFFKKNIIACDCLTTLNNLLNMAYGQKARK